MIFGAHVVLYSTDPAADRAFLRDVLGLASVDAGHGWLIFALPPAEVAIHPAEANGRHELYLMCNDLRARSPHSRTKLSNVPKCTKSGGVLSSESAFLAEARSASINPNIQQPSAIFPTDARP
ncbi:VOC family protein [Tunturiibacter gelidoferens]|uniref:Catechol 2,3-dioxygenase-like lactoylglutathione lyase family enzyme n=1 Tax=Tunturiibacter lichenicola TaxID=2051959 RepID=A0A7Y9NJL3_9BACT|nr:hypothetical protein [Edaphobacter lichenicola]NYF50180.1 catechol 2,3-dioxygenase-like lactoylglutathione lyase family enzyme [Edaphobacter lichenicola]